MLKIKYKNSFDKDIKLAKKRNKKIDKLKEVTHILAAEKPLPEKYKDHKLVGNYVGCRECHIEPDWLLIYKKDATTIIFVRSGSHSDLFRK